MVTIDDLSDDEEDVLRGAWRMAQIEARYRVPPHLQAAAQHLQRRGLAREVPWRGPAAPASGTALELLPGGAALAATLPDPDNAAAFRALGRLIRWGRGARVSRQHDAPPDEALSA